MRSSGSLAHLLDLATARPPIERLPRNLRASMQHGLPAGLGLTQEFTTKTSHQPAQRTEVSFTTHNSLMSDKVPVAASRARALISLSETDHRDREGTPFDRNTCPRAVGVS